MSRDSRPARSAVTPAAPALAVLAALVLTGCGATPATHRAGAATQFWTVPGQSAGHLHADLTSYCGILRSTAGTTASPLAGARPGDATVVATVTAWVTDLEQTAPDPVRAAWRIEGPAIIQLSGGPKATSATAGLQQAGATIAQHARTACGVDLGAAIP